ncbi:MAG: hypothetical protein ACI8ZM_000698 [Crocinitomix sp.]|jgi:hypothetical protein
MTKSLLLLSSLMFLFVSCKKETEYPPNEVVFAGDYNVRDYSKEYDLLQGADSYRRIVTITEEVKTDYRRFNEGPDSGGGSGGLYEDTFDIDVINSNFQFTNDYQWTMDFEANLELISESSSETIEHKLSQTGYFEILQPGLGAEFDFKLKLHFVSFTSDIKQKWFDGDGNIISELIFPNYYTQGSSVRDAVTFNATLDGDVLVLNTPEGFDDCCDSYTRNTFMINEAEVNLTLVLK